tara:strand:- start:179 stop:628 length:450 start_codon:yes stop_codon:yes gene_type:complete
VRYKNIFFLSLSLGLLLTVKFFLGRESFLINVQGRAELLSANLQKGDLMGFSSKPIKKAKILAAFGKVKSTESGFLIPLKRLARKKLITYTNSEGVFNFNLKPGIYTFFILNGNNAYLNSFDGKGYYKSYEIFSKRNDIVITITSKSYF